MKKIISIFIIYISLIQADLLYINIMKKNGTVFIKTQQEWKNKKGETFKTTKRSSLQSSPGLLQNKTEIINLKITEHPLSVVNWKYTNYKVINQKDIKVKYYLDEDKDTLFIQNPKKDFIENFKINAKRGKEVIKRK